jgi:hypothetical protein
MFPKKLKSEANTDMGMFVGVAISDTAEDTHNTLGSYGFENFFDNFDDSVAFGDDYEPCDLCPFWAVDAYTPEDTELLPADVREKDDSIHEHVANAASDVPLDESESIIVEAAGSEADTIVNSDYVGSASTTGQAEEWLLDPGATCGVTYDKNHMTDLKPSDQKITIGNRDKIETLGQGTVTLTDKHGQMVNLTDVYYAQSFTKHIVSMRKLIDDDWSFCIADKTEFVFTDPVTKGAVKFGRNDRDMLYYFSGTWLVDTDTVQLVNSLTTAPVTLDINIAHGLLGHPDTRSVTAMATTHGWTLTGTVKPCGSCALAKARARAIPKSTMTKAKTPGERLFLDISGRYSDSLNKNKYWLRIVDDYTRYSWDCFLPRKSGIQVPLLKLVVMNKAAGKPCKYLRCDNAGENELYVQQVCAENDIQLEMTAPNTPQMNGVVERSFATCKDRAFATMYCARFSLATQGLLWPEAVNTITKIGNSLPRPGLANDPHTAWFGVDAKPNRILGHLQPFGRIAYVTNRNKIKAKLDVRSTKCVFVDYAVDHSGDTYKFYNPLTKRTILSRDVHQWMEWHGRTTATNDLDLFTVLKKLKMHSVILPATPVVPILTDADLPDNSTLSEVPALAPIAEDVPATQAPTGVVPPGRSDNTW